MFFQKPDFEKQGKIGGWNTLTHRGQIQKVPLFLQRTSSAPPEFSKRALQCWVSQWNRFRTCFLLPPKPLSDLIGTLCAPAGIGRLLPAACAYLETQNPSVPGLFEGYWTLCGMLFVNPHSLEVCIFSRCQQCGCFIHNLPGLAFVTIWLKLNIWPIILKFPYLKFRLPLKKW